MISLNVTGFSKLTFFFQTVMRWTEICKSLLVPITFKRKMNMYILVSNFFTIKKKQGFLEYAKTRKGFEETIYFSKKE